MSKADVYEAMAFAKAAKATQIVLVHPKTASAAPTPVGTTTTFERVDVDGIIIWGVEAEVRGIAGKAGLRTFAAGVVETLREIANS